MKFYNRAKEIAELQRIREMAYTDHSKLTVLTSRRRIGKTSLILHALKEETVVYLFVSRKSEADLCSGFCREIETQLAMFVPQMHSFIEVFFLMEQGKTRKFTLVVDEFQEFVNINESIYSEIQNYWDRYRTSTYVNFIVSGSIYSLMTKIFQDKKEPLFGRADAISSSLNTQSQIEAFMGEKSIGGQLSKLETVYEVIKKQRPVFAKEGSQTVRYEVSDNFLRFWFRYIERNRSLIELGNYTGLSKIIQADYSTYSGKTLELYFKQKLQESFDYRTIGSWWEAKGDQNEVDIVAVTLDNKKALVAEVKRQRKNFKPQLLELKIEILKNKVLHKYEVESVCLDLDDM